MLNSVGENREIVVLPRGVGWRVVRLNGRLEVNITCPKCKEACFPNSYIDEDGQILPSLWCPSLECDFHEPVRLDGFDIEGYCSGHDIESYRLFDKDGVYVGLRDA